MGYLMRKTKQVSCSFAFLKFSLLQSKQFYLVCNRSEQKEKRRKKQGKKQKNRMTTPNNSNFYEMGILNSSRSLPPPLLLSLFHSHCFIIIIINVITITLTIFVVFTNYDHYVISIFRKNKSSRIAVQKFFFNILMNFFPSFVLLYHYFFRCHIKFH